LESPVSRALCSSFHISIRRVLLSLFALSLVAAEPAAANCEEHIKPILREHCLKCHGEDEPKADLGLQSHSGSMRGTSDDFGYDVVHDLQATILHLLGINHEQLTYRHAGRDDRLTDVHGRVVEAVLA
jgi:hypothetical protein